MRRGAAQEAARAARASRPRRGPRRVDGPPRRRALGRASAEDREARARELRLRAPQDPRSRHDRDAVGRLPPRRRSGARGRAPVRAARRRSTRRRDRRDGRERSGRRSRSTGARRSATSRRSRSRSAEAARIAELELGAREELVDAELELGRHAEMVAVLEPLVAAHPYRERLRAQLMLALYRSGRQADALATYQDDAAAPRRGARDRPRRGAPGAPARDPPPGSGAARSARGRAPKPLRRPAGARGRVARR